LVKYTQTLEVGNCALSSSARFFKPRSRPDHRARTRLRSSFPNRPMSSAKSGGALIGGPKRPVCELRARPAGGASTSSISRRASTSRSAEASSTSSWSSSRAVDVAFTPASAVPSGALGVSSAFDVHSSPRARAPRSRSSSARAVSPSSSRARLAVARARAPRDAVVADLCARFVATMARRRPRSPSRASLCRRAASRESLHVRARRLTRRARAVKTSRDATRFLGFKKLAPRKCVARENALARVLRHSCARRHREGDVRTACLRARSKPEKYGSYSCQSAREGREGRARGGGGASDARARAMGRRAPSTRAFARARSRGEGDGSRTNVTAWMFARGAAGSFGD